MELFQDLVLLHRDILLLVLLHWSACKIINLVAFFLINMIFIQ